MRLVISYASRNLEHLSQAPARHSRDYGNISRALFGKAAFLANSETGLSMSGEIKYTSVDRVSFPEITHHTRTSFLNGRNRLVYKGSL